MTNDIENKIDEVEATIPAEQTESTEVKTDEQEEAALADERVLALGDTPDFKWYVAHAMSGYENRVAKTLKDRILATNMAEFFAEILVPEEQVVTNVGGKKRRLKKKFFPGYVLLKMIMNDSTWHLVVNTDKITGFIGGVKGKPSPITEDEAAYITNQSEDGFKRVKSSCDFTEGENVKVIEGPFASFVGTIENVGEKGKIRVQVSIFGRPTPVDLDHTQIEKV